MSPREPPTTRTLPALNLVELGFAPRDLISHAVVDQPDHRRHRLAVGGDADVDHVHLTAVLLSRRDPEPGFGGMEGHRHVGLNGLAADLAGGTIDSAGDVAGDHPQARRGTPSGVDGGDGAADRLAWSAGEPGSEQRVHHAGGSLERGSKIGGAVRADVHDRHLAPELAQHPRCDVAVAAVVPATTSDHDRAFRNELRAHTGQRASGTLHQRLRRNPVLPDRPRIQGPLLGGVRQRCQPGRQVHRRGRV